MALSSERHRTTAKAAPNSRWSSERGRGSEVDSAGSSPHLSAGSPSPHLFCFPWEPPFSSSTPPPPPTIRCDELWYLRSGAARPRFGSHTGASGRLASPRRLGSHLSPTLRSKSRDQDRGVDYEVPNSTSSSRTTSADLINCVP